MMRRWLSVFMCILLAGCSSAGKKAASTAVEADDPENQTVDTRSESLSPDRITDYDREAITSLINEDLSEIYGKKGYKVLESSEIMMKKKNGEISAVGTYVSYGTASTSESFKYVFKDENTSYVAVSKENGVQEDLLGYSSGTLNKKPVLTTPAQSYEVSVYSGVSITIKHTDAGSVLIRVLDENGNVAKEIVNTTGPIDQTIETALPTGKYTIQLFTDDWYSIRYACY